MDGFFNQILSLKQEIDQLNVRIDSEIRETRRLESELIKCGEEEKEGVKEEKEMLKKCVGEESDYMDVSARCVALQALNDQSAKIAVKLKRSRDALKQKINQERDAFMSRCNNLQQLLDETEHSTGKAELRERVKSLADEIESRKVLLKQKETRNADYLQQKIMADRSYNSSLLADINLLKEELRCVELSRNSMEPPEVLEEEKRQLQDCILALKSRLASLQGNRRTSG